ncbi:MAG: sigma-54-dependent transcriptional regulator [Polyangiales bacterium]
MRRAPTHFLLGPALLAYLVADAAAAQGQLDLLGALGAGVVGLLSLSALRSWRSDLDGSQRVGWLGLATGFALLRQVAPSGLSLPVELARALAISACAALIADLALTLPDRFTRDGRTRVLRVISYGLGALATLLAVAAQAPALPSLGRFAIMPGWLASAPPFALVLALVLATAMRAARRRFGSSPDALASNAWALLGLLPAVLVAVGAAVGAVLGVDLVSQPVRAAILLAAAAVVFGHMRAADPGRRLSVGPTTRSAVAAVCTLGAVAAASSFLRPLWPEGPLALAAAVVVSLVLAATLYRSLRELSRVVLAPSSGRLLLALERAHAELGEASDLQDVARIALGAARDASGNSASEPVLYLFDPVTELRIDAAGQPHDQAQAMHSRIMEALRQRPGEIVLRLPLEAQIVRQPALRPLIEAVCALDALCVLPLLQRAELEGALVVPLGTRKSSLTLEEIEALHHFGRHLSGFVGVLCAEARAFRRGARAAFEQERAEAQLAQASERLTRAESELAVLRSGEAHEGLDATKIAYSPASRSLLGRIDALAPSATPVLLVAEGGTPLAPFARMLHCQGLRGERPFVVGRCSHEPRDGAAASALRRWTQMAADGTLLLENLPALSLDAQRDLVEVIGQSQARVIATCRREPDRLVEAGALLPELRVCFAECLHVPALRERPEDLPSLILLALDHAARVLGRQSLGIDHEAQEKLLAYTWPGNLDELYAVVERAVAHCESSRVGLRDLPALGPQPGHPLDGTLERVERRVLQRALERAGGNKSEAARTLGLKRTTLIDKLRRHGLDERPSSDAPN